MICFPDRKERYLLPMLPPAAVLTAFGVAWVYRDARARPIGAKLVIGLHLLIVAVLTLGMPLATMLLGRDPQAGDDRPWLAPAVAVPLEVLAVGIVIGLVLAARRWKLGGLVGGTAFALVFVANVFFAGYGRYFNGRSDQRPLATGVRAALPAFQMLYTGRRPPPDLTLFAGRPIRQVEAVARHRTGPPRVDQGPPTVWITNRKLKQPDPPLPPGARLLALDPWRGDVALARRRTAAGLRRRARRPVGFAKRPLSRHGGDRLPRVATPQPPAAPARRPQLLAVARHRPAVVASGLRETSCTRARGPTSRLAGPATQPAPTTRPEIDPTRADAGPAGA